jgi:hypothetical protein
MEHVCECIKNGIYIHIPPFLETMLDVGVLEKLFKKWDVPVSQVSYVVTDGCGNKVTERTTEPVSIGEKYILVLCKIPEPAASGISYISHNGLPVKMPSTVRDAVHLSKNATRFGEDEGRVVAMDGLAEEWMRLTGLQAHSVSGVGLTVKQLLESTCPLNIPRFDMDTREIQRTNVAISQFHTMCSVLGVESVDVSVAPDELATSEVLTKLLSVTDDNDDVE